MQQTSTVYNQLLRSSKSRKEVSCEINGVRYLKDSLMSLETHREVFADVPTIGSCIAGEIDLSLLAPSATIPRMATIKPYVRLTNGATTSEWVQKGEYFIDTRSTTQNADGVPVLTIHGYDSMLKAEQDFIDSGTYPKNASTVANRAASLMGVTVDSRTALTGITVPTLPVGFSCREVLSNIAVQACGNWVMTDKGQLRLLPLNDLPEETNLLVTEYGDIITFGEVGIIV